MNANISNLHIIAPANSPNTDAIDIISSTNLNIQDCIMETGMFFLFYANIFIDAILDETYNRCSIYIRYVNFRLV